MEKVELERLAVLFTEPQRTAAEDTGLLKNLIQLYPYYQPLHLLLAKANIHHAEEHHTLATAALYTNGRLLHNIVFNTDLLEEAAFNVIEAKVSAEKVITTEEGIPAEAEENREETKKTAQAVLDEQEIFEEIGEVDPYDFVTGQPQDSLPGEDPVSKVETLEDDFVLENIVSSDFFAFEQNFPPDDPALVKEDQAEEKIEEHEVAAQSEPEEDSRVSNYNDDKLPYTFLWWLAKTRKEHQSVFQPYAHPKKQSSSGDLQQQYVEHIFHIQSPFNAEEILNNSSEMTTADPKEVEIIDNFIKNAPQIGTPSAEQIDNENKARKSAEDHNDLVSETLAKIYIEQMLYHKAIDTYEKLSLKFPEKSRYFADLIQSIKKKI